MKIILKSVLLLIALMGITACQEDQSDMDPTEPEGPRYVYIYFDLERMPSAEKVGNENMHQYMEEGYTVSFSGAIDSNYETISNVDLGEPLKIEATGDIMIAVSHPEFEEDLIMTSAYYALEEYPLNAGEVDEFTIELNLLQGYVAVNADENFDIEKYDLRVNQEISEFDEVYYLTPPDVAVEIESNGLVTTKRAPNGIGDGLIYFVYEDENGNLVINM